MSSSTIPQDPEALSLWHQVDIAFCPLTDAVEAASNVLEVFGEGAGDPNAQAAIIGPKLREVRKEVYEQVLALCGHETQTPTSTKDSPNAIGHELLMWTTRLDAVRSCLYDEIDGGRMGKFDDSGKLWGAFNILGDVRDGQLALAEKLDAMKG